MLSIKLHIKKKRSVVELVSYYISNCKKVLNIQERKFGKTSSRTSTKYNSKKNFIKMNTLVGSPKQLTSSSFSVQKKVKLYEEEKMKMKIQKRKKKK